MNPFITKGRLWSHPSEIYKTIVLFPLGILRLVCFLIIFFTMVLVVFLPASFGLPPQDNDKKELKVPPPNPPFSFFWIKLTRPFVRAMLFMLGFQRISVKG